MAVSPASVAQRALDALPASLREREVVQSLARRLADELIRYGDGIVPHIRRDDDGSATVELICEDLEAAFLLSEHLSSEAEEAEPLSPEERMAQILDKAEKVKAELAGGLSLQEAIRRELADTDCGACDHPTCDLYSIALADGSDGDNDKCEPGGPKVTAQVELVMTLGRGAAVEAEKILSIEAKAKDDTKREGGLRVLDIGTGRGFPGIALAVLYPDVQFVMLEDNFRRVWFAKRLVNLLGVRNCRVQIGNAADELDALGDRFDLVFVKHMATDAAVRVGLPYARPGGIVVNWQDPNWSDVAADYQRHGLGFRYPLRHPLEFTSAPVEDSVLLLVSRPAEAVEDESEAEAAPESEGDSIAV